MEGFCRSLSAAVGCCVNRKTERSVVSFDAGSRSAQYLRAGAVLGKGRCRSSWYGAEQKLGPAASFLAFGSFFCPSASGPAGIGQPGKRLQGLPGSGCVRCLCCDVPRSLGQQQYDPVEASDCHRLIEPQPSLHSETLKLSEAGLQATNGSGCDVFGHRGSEYLDRSEMRGET